ADTAAPGCRITVAAGVISFTSTVQTDAALALAPRTLAAPNREDAHAHASRLTSRMPPARRRLLTAERTCMAPGKGFFDRAPTGRVTGPALRFSPAKFEGGG